MILSEILKRKKEGSLIVPVLEPTLPDFTKIREIEEKEEEKEEVETLTKEDIESYVLLFSILFFKFYSDSPKIGYGSDFVLLRKFLLGDIELDNTDNNYPPPPLGESINYKVMFEMVYKIPPDMVYFLLQKIKN